MKVLQSVTENRAALDRGRASEVGSMQVVLLLKWTVVRGSYFQGSSLDEAGFVNACDADRKVGYQRCWIEHDQDRRNSNMIGAGKMDEMSKRTAPYRENFSKCAFDSYL
jgi:hypothetical protein